MEPKIVKTRFGSITVREPGGAKVAYDHDLWIDLEGKVHKRKKKLSKQVFGTSHTLSQAEAEHIYQVGAETLIIGTGQYGLVELSDEAVAYLAARTVDVRMEPTPDAIELWNEHQGRAIGLFHITC
jgi:hypothetical protein